ncbi:MAG: PAS domain S-box protein [Methanoregulaceae archaeon]|nr:PAS domain S-box protein [Methanoregulaceae archaeon]
MERIRIRARLITAFILLILVVSVSALAYSHSQATQALKDEVRHELMGVATSTSTQIDGDIVRSLSPGEEGSPAFLAVRDQLQKIRAVTPDIRYIYLMRKGEGGLVFVVDGDYGLFPNAAKIGQPYPEVNQEMLAAFAGPAADREFTTDQWGIVLSGYAPVQDASGEVVGIVGVDMDRGDVARKITYISWFFYLIAVLALVGAGGGIVHLEVQRKNACVSLREREGRYRALFEGANDAILLLENGTITDCNNTTLTLFGCRKDQIVGRTLADFTLNPGNGTGKTDKEERNAAAGTPGNLERTCERCDGTFFESEIGISPVDAGAKRYEQAIIRDISERKRSAEALTLANKKLNLMSSITRHDILNQLTIILGRSRLLAEETAGSLGFGHVAALEAAALKIRDQIEFTAMYQDMGVRAPEWQDLSAVITRAVDAILPYRETVSGISVYADPLLGHVFHNLAHNTVRHGVSATRAVITAERSSRGLVIVYEDDGAGIPPDDKERIFERGFGKNTGYGLFLSREILAITGISIRETGVSGKGARFEILVPDGGYRMPGQSDDIPAGA